MFLVAGMSVKFDAIAKNTPSIKLNCTGVLVIAATNGTAYMSKIHWVVNNFGVQCNDLRMKK